MRIEVEPSTPDLRVRAAALAAELGVPVREPGEPERAADLVLGVDPAGFELRVPGSGARPIRPDTSLLAGTRRGRDDLVRAVIPSAERPWRVIDATAGLGADGFALAAAGAHVTMIERSAVLHVLVREAWRRAQGDAEVAHAANRLQVLRGDARDVLHKLPRAEVVYLDPMYPDLGKRAAKSKEMTLLRDLVGGDTDARDLLEIALERATRRVVVKRPTKAPPLAGRPTGSIGGRSVRFDLYAPGGTLEPSS